VTEKGISKLENERINKFGN